MIKCHWSKKATNPCTLPGTKFSRINNDYYAECDECYENSMAFGQVRVTEKQYILAKAEELFDD